MVRQISGNLFEIPLTEQRWEELLEQAKCNLMSMDYIGFQETFATDFPRIVEQIGLPKVKQVPRYNVTTDLYKKENQDMKDQLSDPAILEMMMDLTCWDQKLYDFAARRFKKGTLQ